MISIMASFVENKASVVCFAPGYASLLFCLVALVVSVTKEEKSHHPIIPLFLAGILLP